MTLDCWKCGRQMSRVEDRFHGFRISAWKCSNCKEVIYDAADIQPILDYNKRWSFDVSEG